MLNLTYFDDLPRGLPPRPPAPVTQAQAQERAHRSLSSGKDTKNPRKPANSTSKNTLKLALKQLRGFHSFSHIPPGIMGVMDYWSGEVEDLGFV